MNVKARILSSKSRIAKSLGRCLVGAALISALFPLASNAALAITNVINLQAISSTTNNGNSFAVGNVTVPTVTYSAQNTGLGNTNDIIYDDQYSLDNSNWTTLTNFHHSVTNQITETFAPNNNPITIYRRVRARAATNSVTAGVQAIRIAP